jgi:hypothetical protein
MLTQRTNSTTPASQFRKGLGIPAALLTLLTLGACSAETGPPSADALDNTYEQEVAEKPETLEQAIADPAEYVGETLTVTGEIVKSYGPQAFAIREEEYFSADEAMLVITNDPEAAALNEGEYVELTGEVQILAVADLDQEYNVALDNDVVEEIEVTYAESPFFVAEDIQFQQVPADS